MSKARIISRVTRSARWALVESLLSASASLGSILVLAHYVGPVEFGRAGIAVAVSAIIQAAALGGMPDAIVRAPSADTRLTDAMFWATLAIGIVGALLIAALGFGTALWWDDARLGALIAVQGITTVAVAAAAVPTGLLLRKFRTRALVNRTAVAKFAGLTASVGFALVGFGAWSVVLGNVFAQGFGAIQLLLTMRRPHFRWHDARLNQNLRIGVLSGAQQTLGTLATRGFVLAFGAVYGVQAVGLFNFALRLAEESCGLVISTLRRVTVTSFAAIKRGKHDLKPLFMRGTNVIAYATAPLFLGGAAVAHDAVLLFFGVKWIGAVPALQLMLCMWVVRATRMLVNAIMIVDGQQRTLVIFGAVGLAATVVAFALSLPFGERWTTLAYAATWFGMIFGGRAFARHTGIGIGDQLRAGLVPIVLAIVMCGGVTALRLGPLSGLAPALRLGAEVAAGLVMFTALALVFDRQGIDRLRTLALRR